MASPGNSLVRMLLLLVIAAAVAIGFYTYRQQGSSANIKAQMLGILDDMNLPPDWHEEAVLLLGTAHEKAFNKALDVTKQHGRKFDVEVYYKEAFGLMIAWAREDGKSDLADRLEMDHTTFVLSVQEN